MKTKIYIKRNKDTFTLRVDNDDNLVMTFNYKDTTEEEQIENLIKLYEN